MLRSSLIELLSIFVYKVALEDHLGVLTDPEHNGTGSYGHVTANPLLCELYQLPVGFLV